MYAGVRLSFDASILVLIPFPLDKSLFTATTSKVVVLDLLSLVSAFTKYLIQKMLKHQALLTAMKLQTLPLMVN